MYKEVAPQYFMYMAANGQLCQPFGRELESSNRCPLILIDLDLMESEAMHRFPVGTKQPPTISISRALLCLILHYLVVQADVHHFQLGFRLKRWPPGSRVSDGATRRTVTHAQAVVFGESPEAVRTWLTMHLPEFVLTRMIPEQAVAGSVIDVNHVDHHARIMIGDVPPQRQIFNENFGKIYSPQSMGLRLQICSSDSFRFGFGTPKNLLSTQLTEEAAFESLGQVAFYAVQCCLSTRSSDLTKLSLTTSEGLML
jgi:hypothetical protein